MFERITTIYLLSVNQPSVAEAYVQERDGPAQSASAVDEGENSLPLLDHAHEISLFSSNLT